MKIKRNRRFATEVATASLNDIMFFLLLFFLIVSTVANPNVIKVLLPKSQASDSLSKQQLVLTVTQDKKYFLGKDEIPFEQLEQALVDQAAQATEPTLILRLAKDLQIQDLVDVMQLGVKHQIKIVLATTRS
ncbi:MAG: biopolymer transporter ExbD [Bacteroidia bacterium]|nr:biopolymer transporter ExbD [Bacteroidia bacterium]